MTTPTLTTPTDSTTDTDAVELDDTQLALVTLQADPGHYQWLTTKAVRQREAATILLANADLADDEQLRSQLALIRRRHDMADRRVQRAAEAEPTSVMRDVHLQTSADLMKSVIRQLHQLLGHTGSLPESMRTS